MNATVLDWERVQSLANSEGRRIARDWPGIDAEDAASEMVLSAVKSPGTLAGMEDAALRSTLRKVGVTYAARERYAYQHGTSQWVYTVPEIRALFRDAFFDPTLWETTPTAEGGDTITSDGIVISLWDMDRAFAALALDDQIVISKRFEYGQELDTAQTKRLSRALDRVARMVNAGTPKFGSDSRDSHNGPGGRRAVSNASARAALSN